jgi:multiple antibiotic resistance protein
MDSMELFISAFVTFFVVIDPIGVAPIFAGLTTGMDRKFRSLMAWKACLIGAGVLIGFAFGGEWLFDKLHVSLDAFRIAGGVLLFLIALDMLFEKRTERREERAEEVLQNGDPANKDISVFPMAIPMIAGPGAIASAMLFMTANKGDLAAQGLVLSAIGLNIMMCLALFLAIGPVMKVMGHTLAAMITRILGVVLAALAAQFIIDGVIGAMSAMPK